MPTKIQSKIKKPIKLMILISAATDSRKIPRTEPSPRDLPGFFIETPMINSATQTTPPKTTQNVIASRDPK
jgi:hypothetical protein